MISLGTLRTDFPAFLKNVSDVDVMVKTCMDKMSQLEVHIASLMTHRNTFAYVSRIPTEVMEGIFMELARPSLLRVEDSLRQDDQRHGDIQNYKWLTVTKICRHWRAVASHCPRLWSQLDCALLCGRNMNRFLSLSKQCSLSVKHVQSRAQYRVLQHRHRILHLHDFNLDSQSLSNFCATDAVPQTDVLNLPVLKSFRVDCSLRTNETDADEYLLHASTPSLRRLDCMGISWRAIRHMASQATNLTCLKVSIAKPPKTYTVGEWLELLQRLPLLQELYISGAISQAIPGGDKYPPLRNVVLRQLTRLSLTTGPGPRGSTPCDSGLASILSRVACPLDASVQVQWTQHPGDAGYPSPATVYRENLHRLLSSVSLRTSAHSNGAPYHVQYNHASLSSEQRHELQLEVSLYNCTSDQGLVAAVPLHITLPLSLSYTTEELVADLSAAPGIFSGISYLSVSYVACKASTWTQLATSNRMRLVGIHIYTRNTFLAFLGALEASLAEGTPGTFLPRLHELSVAPACFCTPSMGPQRLRGARRARARELDEETKRVPYRLFRALKARQRLGLGPSLMDVGDGLQAFQEALQKLVDVDLSQVPFGQEVVTDHGSDSNGVTMDDDVMLINLFNM